MTEVVHSRTINDELDEMNRFSDLMIGRGLATLFLRELKRLQEPSDDEIREWKEFAVANILAGGLVGMPLSRELMDLAVNRATETISACFEAAR